MDLFSSCLFKSADRNARVWSLKGQQISLFILGRHLEEFEEFILPCTFICKCPRIQTNVSPNKKEPDTHDYKIRLRTLSLFQISPFCTSSPSSSAEMRIVVGHIFQITIQYCKEILADQKDSFVTIDTSRVRQLMNDGSWIWFKLMEYSEMCQSASKLE